MAKFKRVAKGDPLEIPAAFYNGTADMLNRFGSGGQAFSIVPTSQRSNVLADWHNTSATDCRFGDVARIDAAILDGTDSDLIGQYLAKPAFEGNIDDTSDFENFGICLDLAEADKMVPIVVSGICVANINMGSTSHKFARPEAESRVLVSDVYGPVQILDQPTSTDEQRVWVRLGAPILPRSFVAQVTSTISARSGSTVGSGAIQPKYLSGTTISNWGSTVTAKNFAASSIAADTYVFAQQDEKGTIWVTAEDCG